MEPMSALQASTRTTALLALLAVGTACGSGGPADGTPASPPATLLIDNDSCAAGRCMTIELRAFVWGFRYPQNPLGGRSIAFVPPGRHCVALPDSLVLTVIGPVDGPHPDTTITVWRQDDPAGIHLIAVDSAALHGGPATQVQADSINQGIYPYDGLGPSIGESVTFIPADADGWRVGFPAAPVHSGAVDPSDRCGA